MHWTPEQESALASRGSNLLLSASAGSGKTAVLTERIKRLVTDETHPVSIQELLVLTFTHAAAGEMRSRVGAALSDALEQARLKGDEYRTTLLERQIALLGSASVSTLDSFFQSLVRRYFYLIDLDPKTRIVSDENELYLLSQDVLAQVLETYYENPTPAFSDLVAFLATRHQDTELKNAVLNLSRFAASMPFPEEWIASFPDAYAIPDDAEMGQLSWTKDVLDSFRLIAEECCDNYRFAASLADQDPALSAYGERLGEEYAFFSVLASKIDWTSWYETVGSAPAETVFPRMPAVKKSDSLPDTEERKKTITTLRQKIKKHYTDEIEPFFAISPIQWLRDMRAMHPLVQTLSAVTVDFLRALRKRKQQERIMDFSDMEHYALDILLDRNNPNFTVDRAIEFPSETALTLRKQYKEVMIDEYQDTNGVQELLTALLSDGRNRFMVGDVKQSIYRFRQADPTIFSQKYESYSDDGNASSRRIVLNQNFRGDRAILSSVNYLFRQIMSKDELELAYGDKESLYPGRREEPRPPSYAGGAVTVTLIDQKALKDRDADISLRDMESITAEGRFIASRIRKLIDDGSRVTNGDGSFRPIDYNDIVILLRSVSTKGPTLLKVLQEADIPALSDREDDFVQNTEVRLLWSLLQILDNPLQDLPLLAVLRSFFAGLSETDFALLALVRQERRLSSLWESLSFADGTLHAPSAHIIRRFLDLYRTWRTLSRRDGLSPLLRRILDDTDYLPYISGLPGGRFRTAHVEAFCSVAAAFDESDKGGLAAFLDYLQETVRAGKTFRSVSSPTGSSAVRIMSIHKSKGLEFPVVFLADTAKSFNKSDSRQSIISHRILGLGMQYFDRDHLVRWPTLYWYALRRAVQKENLAEEARLLYVAMTRARDALYITASSRDAARTVTDKTISLPSSPSVSSLPPHLVSNASSYLDWILPAMARHPSVKTLWDFIGRTPIITKDAPSDKSLFRFSVIDARNLLTEEETRHLTCSDEPIEENITAPSTDTPSVEKRIAAFLLPSDRPISADMCTQFAWRYTWIGATETPAKLTATAAVRAEEEKPMPFGESHAPPSLLITDESPSVPNKVLPPPATEILSKNMDMNEENSHSEKNSLPPGFDEEPRFLSAEETTLTGSDYGTLMHKAMEILDVIRIEPTAVALETELRRLIDNGRFTENESRVFLRGSRRQPSFYRLLSFFTGDLADDLRQADTIWKEMPFSVLVPANRFYPRCEDGESVFLQGVIDCMSEHNGDLTIIDYKTDRVSDEEELKTRYTPQLRLYKQAAEQLLQKPVTSLLLYSFSLGKSIPVD